MGIIKGEEHLVDYDKYKDYVITEDDIKRHRKIKEWLTTIPKDEMNKMLGIKFNQK